MTSDSRITDVRTWRRDAPIVRSVANSRGALGDGDRERVEDDERAHEQGDPREREEEVPGDRGTWPISSFASSTSWLALTTSASSGSTGAIASTSSSSEYSLARGDRDRVELPLATEELLRGRDREHGEARAPEAVDAAVLGDADELEVALGLEQSLRPPTVSPTA